jgi:hypothetical protein
LPFGEKRDPATASKLKRMGVTKGWPDFMLVRRADMRTLAGGFVAFLELKSHSGRLSAEQADIAAHLMAAGFGYLCTSDFGDAFKALTPWGVIPANVRLG